MQSVRCSAQRPSHSSSGSNHFRVCRELPLWGLHAPGLLVTGDGIRQPLLFQRFCTAVWHSRSHNGCLKLSFKLPLPGRSWDCSIITYSDSTGMLVLGKSPDSDNLHKGTSRKHEILVKETLALMTLDRRWPLCASPPYL